MNLIITHNFDDWKRKFNQFPQSPRSLQKRFLLNELLTFSFDSQAASIGAALSINKILKNLNTAPTFFIGGLGEDDDGTWVANPLANLLYWMFNANPRCYFLLPCNNLDWLIFVSDLQLIMVTDNEHGWVQPVWQRIKMNAHWLTEGSASWPALNLSSPTSSLSEKSFTGNYGFPLNFMIKNEKPEDFIW